MYNGFHIWVKRAAAAVLAGASVVAMAACGSSGATDSGDKAKTNADAMISVNNTEPQSPLVPANTNEMGGGRILRYLFEGLVSYDAKGKQHMEVAKSITPNADATQYTVRLNDGWKFTNGEPVTATSFTDAWSFAANVKNAQKQGSRMSVIKGYDELQNPNVDSHAKLSGLQVKDPHTFVVTLDGPDSVFPVQVAHPAFYPLPSSAYKDITAFGKAPIGDGPYKFKSWTPGSNVTVVRNPNYHGLRKVANGGIEFRVYSSPDSAYSDVQSGNLDLLMDVPQSAVKTFRSDSSVKAYSKSGSAFMSISIPERINHFGPGREGTLRRQAISMALDRDQIIDKVYYGTKTASTDFTSAEVPEHAKSLKGSDNLKHNAKKAKKLWAQADAISKDTDTFSIGYASDGGHKPWVDAACNQIKNTLGIKAVGDAYPTFSDIVGHMTDRSIKTPFLLTWSLDYPSAEDYMTPLYASYSADGRGTNLGDYKSRDFDAALGKAKSELDTATRTKDFDAAQEILLNDLPVIPMWNSNVAAVSTPTLGHVGFDYANIPTFNTITKG